jgi:hypothetical protein
MTENKRDLSISMERASVIVVWVSIPVAVAQFALFNLLHGAKKMDPTWNYIVLLVAILLGIVLHELIHAVTWVIFGRKSFSKIKFGFQWKTLTPYAHLTEPIEVNAYRLGAFMPGFILGIVVYCLSLSLGDGSLFWFSLVHTSAAGGDWLVLWLIRNLTAGTMVEDHPTHAGCYVIETRLEPYVKNDI